MTSSLFLVSCLFSRPNFNVTLNASIVLFFGLPTFYIHAVVYVPPEQRSIPRSTTMPSSVCAPVSRTDRYRRQDTDRFVTSHVDELASLT